MMRALKARHVSFTRPAEPRTRRLAIIRWVYLTSIFALVVWLANFFFGDLLYLRSEGLVVGQPSVVAAEFPVTVRDILVREGEQVKAGQIAAAQITPDFRWPVEIQIVGVAALNPFSFPISCRRQ